MALFFICPTGRLASNPMWPALTRNCFAALHFSNNRYPLDEMEFHCRMCFPLYIDLIKRAYGQGVCASTFSSGSVYNAHLSFCKTETTINWIRLSPLFVVTSLNFVSNPSKNSFNSHPHSYIKVAGYACILTGLVKKWHNRIDSATLR